MPASAVATAAGVGSASMKKSKPEPIPVMDYRQYRRARRLVHECCNYDGGNCIALDDGEECVCVQVHFLLPTVPVGSGRRCCRWTTQRSTVFHRLDAKRCAVCGALFTPSSNRAKYCPECAVQVKPEDEYTVYEVEETDTDEEADLLNFDDLDRDEFV